jgi:hypothetical protein
MVKYGEEYPNNNNNNNNNNKKPTRNNVIKLEKSYRNKQHLYKRYYGNNAALNGPHKVRDKRGFFKRLFGLGKPTLYRKGANNIMTRKNREKEIMNNYNKFNNALRHYTRKNN